ncbi:MAG: hypothetical protein R2800_01895 [Flavipsychrobacter sp.]
MEDSITIDNMLWFLVGFLASGMAALLVFGWLKGQHFNREEDLKMKRRHK